MIDQSVSTTCRFVHIRPMVTDRLPMIMTVCLVIYLVRNVQCYVRKEQLPLILTHLVVVVREALLEVDFSHE